MNPPEPTLDQPLSTENINERENPSSGVCDHGGSNQSAIMKVLHAANVGNLLYRKRITI